MHQSSAGPPLDAAAKLAATRRSNQQPRPSRLPGIPTAAGRLGFSRQARVLPALCFAAFWIQAGQGLAQTAPGTQRYEFRQVHDPDGIGKFYMGREIAQVMGHLAADWLERPEREQEEHAGALAAQLDLKAGAVVADVGAGTGYFTRRLAQQVGRQGKVLAVDIQPEMLQLLTNKMADLGITNVVPVLGSVTNPGLPAASLDLVLMVDVYHEFEFPYEMMSAICHSLKPTGRAIFVEFRGEDPEVPIKPLHKMTQAQVRKEMAVQPLRWVRNIEVLPRQHIIEFANQSGQR